MGSQLFEAQLQPQAEWREIKAGETFFLLLEKCQYYPRGLRNRTEYQPEQADSTSGRLR